MLAALFMMSAVLPTSAQLMVSEPDHYIVWQVKPFNHQVKAAALSTGVTLQFVEQGNTNGIPVILLHGITDSWHSYESLLHNLPDNIHAYAITMRGHGDSERPESGYEMKDFANDVAAFIQKFKLGKVIVVGHSMGGLVAQQLVLDHPSLVKGLVILGSDASMSTNAGVSEFVAEVKKLNDPIDPAFADAFQKSTLTREIDPEYFSVLVAEGLKVPARVWKQAFDGVMNANYENRLKEIQQPTLIVWGDKDNFCTREDQEVLLKGIKYSRLVVYENTGHALHWEQPKRVANDITEFANRVSVLNNF